MLIDAPLCYPYQTWEHNRHIVEIILSYGNVLLQPEGGRDAAWMTESGYNCIQDYGFYYKPGGSRGWGGKDALVEAINTGSAGQIEPCLKSYHDEMVQSGAVLYARLLNLFDGNKDKRHLQMAILAGIGDILAYAKMDGNPDGEETAILHLKGSHPALYPVALRQTVSTNAGDRCYAFLKTARDKSERIFCIYNLQPVPQSILANVTIFDASEFVDLQTQERIQHANPFEPMHVDLPAYGYRFFEVLQSGEPRARMLKDTSSNLTGDNL
jgi:hypothetical protein